jgi:uncharacterized protein YbjT (DUF2867 family)
VTYLSAYGMDAAPPEVGPRAVEFDLLSRNDFTYSIVRPAWFMQNFSEAHLAPVDGFITVPTGQGTESFVDAQDIPAVAAATLADPGAHAGAQYAPTSDANQTSPADCSPARMPVSHPVFRWARAVSTRAFRRLRAASRLTRAAAT